MYYVICDIEQNPLDDSHKKHPTVGAAYKHKAPNKMIYNIKYDVRPLKFFDEE